MSAMVANMPREKSEKKNEQPAPHEAGEKPIKNVKLTPSFHRKLKVIAAEVGKDLGEIIEAEMRNFIEREWQRIRQSG